MRDAAAEDAELRMVVVEVIREQPGIRSREIRDRVRARRNRANHDALQRLVVVLLAEGIIENRGTSGRHAYFVVAGSK